MAFVLGQMMWGDGGDHMSDGWWWAMGIGWLVFLLFLAALAVVLIRQFAPGGGHRQRAEDLLAERFARGDIDENEYRQRREALRS